MYYRVELIQNPQGASACRLLLFDNHNQAIGHASGEFRQYPQWYNGQRHFFVNELVVNQQVHRQQGVGSKLLKAVEIFARQQGAQWIRGQCLTKPTEYTDLSMDDQALTTFWNSNGYGHKREIYDDSVRFWKPIIPLSAQLAFILAIAFI